MGLHFGELYKMRIITFKLSPFELRACAGMISHGLPNMVRRVVEEVPYVVPPLALGYVIYAIIEAIHAKSLRKDPKVYENDK